MNRPARTMSRRAAAALAFSLAALPAAHALCTSDGVAAPQAVLERFVSADCMGCWTDPATPAARAGELAIDWIVPGRQGDDAPLSMGASREALDRLALLKRPVPDGSDARRVRRTGSAPALRVAQGEPFNDYIGTSIALKPAADGARAAWLLLVEELPAGAEGSPVPRNLVRNVFRPGWEEQPLPRGARTAGLLEQRPMQIHEGTRPSRLRLVALVEDASGRMRAIARTECRP